MENTQITLTPEEKLNQEIWWILQEIKKEQLSTAKGEKVEFSLRLPSEQSKKIDGSISSADTQRKLLRKLKELNAIDLKIKPDPLVNTILTPPTSFLLVIKQPKFDELYSSYETSSIMFNVQRDRAALFKQYMERSRERRHFESINQNIKEARERIKKKEPIRILTDNRMIEQKITLKSVMIKYNDNKCSCRLNIEHFSPVQF